MQQILTYTFLVFYTVTILSIVLVIITDNRNPLKTLPWIIVLVFAPVVGLVFYFFFGQNLSKRRIISRRTRRRITMQLEEARDTGRPEIPEEHRRLAALLYSTTHSVALYGSRITPYTDGRSKMEALLAEIACAKHHIHIQYYIFSDDETGRRLRDALVEKARQGGRGAHPLRRRGQRGPKNPFSAGCAAKASRSSRLPARQIPALHQQSQLPQPPQDRRHRRLRGIPRRHEHRRPLRPRHPMGHMARHPFPDRGQRRGGPPGVVPERLVGDHQTADRRGGILSPRGAHAENIMQIVSSGPFGKWRTLLQADSYAIARARRRFGSNPLLPSVRRPQLGAAGGRAGASTCG